MDSQQKSTLAAAGINVPGALPRFMNKEAMLEKYLVKFLSEKSFPALEAAISANDTEAALMAAHTHKSVSGSIGCDKLHEMMIAQEAAFRAGDFASGAAMMPEVKAEHDKVCKAIQEALG